MEFADHTVKISSTNPSIPDIIVSAFKVCGQIVSEKSYTVSIKGQSIPFHTTVQTQIPSGEWCTFLENGRYNIEVIVNNDDRANGIQFFPINQEINVKSSSLSGIVFSQLRATVTGEVKCLPDADSSCTLITIIMNSINSQGNIIQQYNSVELKNGKYTFENVLPGYYEVVVHENTKPLCWENQKYKLNVKSEHEIIPTFVQSGYSISIISSHKTDVSLKFLYNSHSLINKFFSDDL